MKRCQTNITTAQPVSLLFSLWRPSVAHSNPAAKVMLILRWCDNCTDVEQDEKLRELRDPPDLEL